MFPLAMGGAPGSPGAGEVSLPLGTDLTWAIGSTLHMQAVFGDSNGPTGKTLTNGVSVTVQ